LINKYILYMHMYIIFRIMKLINVDLPLTLV